MFNPLTANPTKWSNTLKQFVGKLFTNCLGTFDHFVWVALKGLSYDTGSALKNNSICNFVKLAYCSFYLIVDWPIHLKYFFCQKVTFFVSSAKIYSKSKGMDFTCPTCYCKA